MNRQGAQVQSSAGGRARVPLRVRRVRRQRLREMAHTPKRNGRIAQDAEDTEIAGFEVFADSAESAEKVGTPTSATDGGGIAGTDTLAVAVGGEKTLEASAGFLVEIQELHANAAILDNAVNDGLDLDHVVDAQPDFQFDCLPGFVTALGGDERAVETEIAQANPFAANFGEHQLWQLYSRARAIFFLCLHRLLSEEGNTRRCCDCGHAELLL